MRVSEDLIRQPSEYIREHFLVSALAHANAQRGFHPQPATSTTV